MKRLLDYILFRIAHFIAFQGSENVGVSSAGPILGVSLFFYIQDVAYLMNYDKLIECRMPILPIMMFVCLSYCSLRSNAWYHNFKKKYEKEKYWHLKGWGVVAFLVLPLVIAILEA